MNQISKLDNATGITSPSSYMVDAFVHQLGRGLTKNSTESTLMQQLNNTPENLQILRYLPN